MEDLLREAVRLAAANADTGQLPFAALVVRDGEVLGMGCNSALRDKDPTAHAEIEAVRDACRRLGTLTLDGAIVVSSCEPCPMCQSTAVLVGIERIVYAAPKESAARHGMQLSERGARMQQTWREANLQPIEHVPVDGADEPFERFAAATGAGGGVG
jgi:tRNA(Arg) A34 adenosine deaminase TadA